MFVYSASFYDLEPAEGEYTKTQTASLTGTRYYKLVYGGGETDIFPADVSGIIPVKMNVHHQGGASVDLSLASNTLTITSNRPGLGTAMLIEYSEVTINATNIRSYVTNWPDYYNVGNWPEYYNVGNWPDTYNVTGEVSISNWPDTQTVSGEVAISNWPSNQTISGEVSLSSQTISDLADAIAAAISGGNE